MSSRYFMEGIVISALAIIVMFHASIAAKNKHVRIVGGQVISIDKAPYLVQLRYRDGEQFCGGSLVEPQYVVTAAHCVRDSSVNDVIVVGGVSNRSEPGIEYAIEKITMHPSYSYETMHSDVAVLKLTQPMSGDYIRTIKLMDHPLKEGNMIQASGWGQTDEDEEESEELRTVTIPVAPQERCQSDFRQYVGNNMFCASGLEPIGVCSGDSGGPGVSEGKLAGVGAFTTICGMVDEYSVFTDVYATRSFILNALKA